ncbi:MAG: hypothetical protein RIC95_13140 [Vicingaceae bacterium]
MSTFQKDERIFDAKIDKSTAVSMVQEYLSHPNRLTLGDGQTLKALVVDSDDISALVDLDAKAYMVLFSVSDKDVGKEPSEQRFTTILAAIDQDDKIVTTELRNKFKPCPSDCHNYSEVFEAE